MNKIISLVTIFFAIFVLSGCSAKIDSLEIVESSVSIGIGETVFVKTLFEPANEEPDLVWKSSNGTVASVQSGSIFGISKGTSIISVEYGDYSDSVTVTVVDIQEELVKVYEDLLEAADILGEISDSIIGAWHYGIYDSDDYSGETIVTYLWLETGDSITSSSDLVEAFNDGYGTDYSTDMVGWMLSGDFSKCVNTVKQAYILNYSFSTVLSKLDSAKEKIQSLDSEVNGYSELQNLYLEIKALYDDTYSPQGNYSTFSTTINTHMANINSKKNSIEFIID